MTSSLTWAQHWVLRQLRFDRTPEDRATDLPSTLDEWARGVEAARELGLSGLLASRLPKDLIPAGARGKLDRLRRGTAYSNVVISMALEEWLGRFGTAGIPVIVVKGAALTRMIYGNVEWRPMLDIDFLVEREHFEDAARLLTAGGLRRVPNVEGTEHSSRTAASFFSAPPNTVYIDLHWHLVDLCYYARKMPIEWFWNHSVVLEEKPPMRVLSPEAMLLHLSSHLELHHAGSNFLGLYDIASLLHRFGNSLNWDTVFECAANFEVGQSLRIALRRAHSVFGAPLSSSASERAEQLPSTLHERLARVLARPEAHPAVFVFDGLDQANWSLRLRYWQRSLFPAQAFMHARHSDPAAHSTWPYMRRLARGLVRIPRALAASVRIYRQISSARIDDYLGRTAFP